MQHSLVFLASVGVSLATPPSYNVPHVTIQNGTLIGKTNNSVDSFIGIPYVKPPINDLRFRAPQSIEESFGVLELPEVAPACIQMHLSDVDTTGIPAEAVPAVQRLSQTPETPQSEDCLTVTVQRPAGVSPGQRLPVLAWIHGGGWEIGASQWYDGTAIVRKSMNMSEPVVFVSMNYRLGAFGFLHGKELSENGSTNLGLRDQRKALEWIAENIGAFGGDSDRVTIWGESAGAASVFDHLTINNGDHTYRGKPLFRGGIMNSCTLIRTLSATSAKAQGVFDGLVTAAGCANSTETLACLRRASTETLRVAAQSFGDFYTVKGNNLPFIRRPDESDCFFSQFGDEALESGRYARVPVIAGSLEDEATIFALSQREVVNSTETLVDYMASWFPETDRQVIANLIDTYPDDPAAGIPSGTGNLYELYPQFKRNAAVQTDVTFAAARRALLSQMQGEVPIWAWLGTFQHALPQLGTYHTSDLGTHFRGLNPVAGNAINAAYIHFVHHLDPNGRTRAPWWPQWDEEGLVLANFSASETGLTRDDFRRESFDFINAHSSEIRQ
ncbi:unnamed protein product [Clonostachys byssicola]|uniref:Carboxylic ester hydrolase n=1 Tax=Clonostachys byssicola TaxID=160290 RepID=A0A9N9UR10_9HYPO|nr:unnamed protein product [Clonostachys byssicola]